MQNTHLKEKNYSMYAKIHPKTEKTVSMQKYTLKRKKTTVSMQKYTLKQKSSVQKSPYSRKKQLVCKNTP